MATRLRAYRTELDPTEAQAAQFRRHAGAARYVYNWSLGDRKERYEAGEKTGLYEQKRRFNAEKDALCPWIRETLYRVTEQALMNADSAFKNFFRRVTLRRQGTLPDDQDVGFPKFKSRRYGLGSFVLRDCAVTPTRIWMDSRYFGWVRLKEHGYLPSTSAPKCRALRATFTERAGRWYCSLQVEEQVEEPTPPAGEPMEVAVGLGGIFTWQGDTEHVYQHRRPFAAQEERIAALQRHMQRQEKGSRKREKTRRKLAKLHERIANVREHGLHQISHAITSRAPAELRFVPAPVEAGPLLQDHRTAKRTADAALFEVQRQIRYKSTWRGIGLPAERDKPAIEQPPGAL